MAGRRELTLLALRMALATRRDHRVSPSVPINVYALAEEAGVEVLFQDLRGVEGLYLSKPKPMILISAQRPLGRQVYTCAHELGHHFAGHGTKADDQSNIGAVAQGKAADEEFLVESFAGFLLMPPRAVREAFEVRGAHPASCSLTMFYTVARALGVGYGTLVHHSHRVLNLIDAPRSRMLTKATPKKIKTLLLGQEFTGDVVVIDEHWPDIPLEMRVGDVVLAQDARIASGTASLVNQNGEQGVVFQGRAPGEAKVEIGHSTRLIRVSRAGYVGRATNRFLEDPDYE